MQRTASVYDLSAQELLDRWLPPRQIVQSKPSVQARVVAASAITDVMGRIHALPEAMQAMLPSSDAWLVGSDTDIAVCTRCLL
jgi:hypothetical protein